MRLRRDIKHELIDAEREFIYALLRDGKITDEARRRIEYELDLEEASVANRAHGGGGGCSFLHVASRQIPPNRPAQRFLPALAPEP